MTLGPGFIPPNQHSLLLFLFLLLYIYIVNYIYIYIYISAGLKCDTTLISPLDISWNSQDLPAAKLLGWEWEGKDTSSNWK
ncbi:unnamed protein product [Camellia sinensis]